MEFPTSLLVFVLKYIFMKHSTKKSILENKSPFSRLRPPLYLRLVVKERGLYLTFENGKLKVFWGVGHPKSTFLIFYFQIFLETNLLKLFHLFINLDRFQLSGHTILIIIITDLKQWDEFKPVPNESLPGLIFVRQVLTVPGTYIIDWVS